MVVDASSPPRLSLQLFNLRLVESLCSLFCWGLEGGWFYDSKLFKMGIGMILGPPPLLSSYFHTGT